MNRIVIIHTGGIGDLVVAMPVLAGLRARWPTAKITLIGLPRRAAFPRMAGYVDAVLDFETCGLSGLFSSGGRLPPPLAQADLVLTFITGAQFVENLKEGVSGQVVAIEPKFLPDSGLNAAESILSQVGPILQGVHPQPRIDVPLDVRRRAEAALAEMQIQPTRFLAIHPGSGSVQKNWPVGRFAEIAGRAARRGVANLWLLGPAEIERGIEIPAGAATAVLEDPDLPLAAGILMSAMLYVGNDSGISHLAGAVGTPSVVLFGPSDARLWRPGGAHVHVILTTAACAPCADAERTRCRRGDCMDAIGVEEVWEAVAARITRGAEENARGSKKS